MLTYLSEPIMFLLRYLNKRDFEYPEGDGDQQNLVVFSLEESLTEP
jgi:hypothetical protein